MEDETEATTFCKLFQVDLPDASKEKEKEPEERGNGWT